MQDKNETQHFHVMHNFFLHKQTIVCILNIKKLTVVQIKIDVC